MLLLNMNHESIHRFPGARLISRYYPIENYPRGCLYLSYRSQGPGFKQIFIIQQDDQNRCIFFDKNNANKNQDHRSSTILSKTTTKTTTTTTTRRLNDSIWIDHQLSLNFRHGSEPRFFLDIYLDPYEKRGFFALGNFSIKLDRNGCGGGEESFRSESRNDFCQDQINRHINVAPTSVRR
ncbi:zinc finger protein [Sarcoptes scabiei]|nr:zinc finger protein [Sarcoptes scabiei]